MSKGQSKLNNKMTKEKMKRQMERFNKKIKEGYKVNWGESRQEGKTTKIVMEREKQK